MLTLVVEMKLIGLSDPRSLVELRFKSLPLRSDENIRDMLMEVDMLDKTSSDLDAVEDATAVSDSIDEFSVRVVVLNCENTDDGIVVEIGVGGDAVGSDALVVNALDIDCDGELFDKDNVEYAMVNDV